MFYVIRERQHGFIAFRSNFGVIESVLRKYVLRLGCALRRTGGGLMGRCLFKSR